MNRKGFTLIELLVVIGIIAVLSAILFPVLRIAQQSAKKIACIAHFKQAGAAFSMYATDNDERFVLAAHNPLVSSTSANNKRWPQLVMPYVKEIRMFRCPRDPFPGALPSASFDPDLVNLIPSQYEYALAERTNIGYNYLYLAPISNQNNRYIATSRTYSEVSNVTNTILAVDSVWQQDASGRPHGGGSYLVVPPCRYYSGSSSDTFKLSNADVFMVNPGWRRVNGQLKSFGGVYPWHEDFATVLYGDSHVSTKRIADVSRGCIVGDGLDGPVQDSGEYMWDLD